MKTVFVLLILLSNVYGHASDSWISVNNKNFELEGFEVSCKHPISKYSGHGTLYISFKSDNYIFRSEINRLSRLEFGITEADTFLTQVRFQEFNGGIDAYAAPSNCNISLNKFTNGSTELTLDINCRNVKVGSNYRGTLTGLVNCKLLESVSPY